MTLINRIRGFFDGIYMNTFGAAEWLRQCQANLWCHVITVGGLQDPYALHELEQWLDEDPRNKHALETAEMFHLDRKRNFLRHRAKEYLGSTAIQ
jgi:ferric-dicitrate binding protein FerR (iron transport regulator)